MPSYKIVDVDTAHVLGQFNADPGASIQVFAPAPETWKRTANFVVPVVNSGDPVVIPPDPVPVATGGLFNPKSGSELQSAFQKALDEGYLLVCDPRARPEITAPINVKVRDRGTSRHGIVGFGMRLCGKLTQPGNALMTVELGNLQNRHLFIENLTFDDQSYMGNASADGLVVKARRNVGENGLYSFHMNKLLFEGAKDGLTVDGYVFEGIIDAPEATNCDRCLVLKMDAGNILSNVIVRTPIFRAARIGIDCEYANSVMVTGSGSFIDITERSIRATNGIKLVDGSDFENAGNGYAIEIQGTDWPMTLLNLTGSNTDPGRFGVGMPYLIKYTGDPQKLARANNKMNYQGLGTFTPDSTVN